MIGFPVPIVNLNHVDVLVGTAVRASRTPDTRLIVNDHVARGCVATDRAGRTTNHANWINAMHASSSHHPLVVLRPFPQEPWIVVMGRSTRTNTIVTPCAAIEIDEHRLRAVDMPPLNQKLHQSWIDVDLARGLPTFGSRNVGRREDSIGGGHCSAGRMAKSTIRPAVVGIRNTSTYPTARKLSRAGCSVPVLN